MKGLKGRVSQNSLNTLDWENDRKLVMSNGASFLVKLLGVVEVEKGRGVDVCEAAIQSLKGSTKNKRKLLLTVRADALRSVDEETNEVVFDQPIEKVSFCSPFPGHTRLFSYIAREAHTKTWICHCFASMKEPGERVCHAMGCAFTACMRRQQTRIAELNKQRAAKKARQAAEEKSKSEAAAAAAAPAPVRLGLSCGAELLFDDDEMEGMLSPDQMACAPVEQDKTTLALEKAIEEVEKALQLAKVKVEEAPEAEGEEDSTSTEVPAPPADGETANSGPVLSMTNPFQEDVSEQVEAF
ncbi:numb-like protein [Sycon ciliatum]|uniref:numb-like protein n=1 Tax=Sycon ciliatum TaxID=27933 RepID=UPI0020ADC935|eukprot:scpid69569/ scgid21750/ Numb-like protein